MVAVDPMLWLAVGTFGGPDELCRALDALPPLPFAACVVGTATALRGLGDRLKSHPAGCRNLDGLTERHADASFMHGDSRLRATEGSLQRLLTDIGLPAEDTLLPGPHRHRGTMPASPARHAEQGGLVLLLRSPTQVIHDNVLRVLLDHALGPVLGHDIRLSAAGHG
jgi:hypothetical protein